MVIGNITPPRKRADFRRVFRHEIVRRLRRDRSSLNLGVATATGASLSYGENWHAINWQQVYRNVRRLQTRIVKAVKAGKKRRVRALRYILTRSFSGKALPLNGCLAIRANGLQEWTMSLWNTPKKKATSSREPSSLPSFWQTFGRLQTISARIGG